MLPFNFGDGPLVGLLVKWEKNLLARYNRHVASLASLPDDVKERTYQEALQYKGALEAISAVRNRREPDWEENREELEYYLDWEFGDPMFDELPVEELELIKEV